MSITVHNVSKSFGDFAALGDVSLDIHSGSLTALLGPSGSGKSTLLRVIAGLESPDSGRVHISGEEKTGDPPQSREVGFVFQHYAAFKHMTVSENVAFGLKVRKHSKKQIQFRVSELLDLVQLEGFSHRYPAQLSGGQRQRMALARALAIKPEVLLLDEPFGALDATVRQELRAWLRKLHEEVNVTTVLVTHDQEEAMEVASEIVVMNHGGIEQTGSPQQVYENPATEFVMGFVGPVTRLGAAYVRPHDLHIRLEAADSTTAARVSDLLHLGFEVRVELALESGESLWAQVTRQNASDLGLERGKTVHVVTERSRVFD